MAMSISRRQFFDRGTSLAALAGLISACGDGTTVPVADELSSTTTSLKLSSTSTLQFHNAVALPMQVAHQLQGCSLSIRYALLTANAFHSLRWKQWSCNF